MSSRRFASNIPNSELGCLIQRSCKKIKAVSICKFGAIEVSKGLLLAPIMGEKELVPEESMRNHQAKKGAYLWPGAKIVLNMGSLLASFVAQICKVHLRSVHMALFYGFQYSSDEELYVSLCVILTSIFDVIHVPSNLVQYYTKTMAHPDERDTNRKGSPYYLAI
ncbi:hypothetical protein ACFE04_029544 [Oxalis oulophora]